MPKRLPVPMIAPLLAFAFALLPVAETTGKSAQTASAAATASAEDPRNLSGVWFTKPRAGRSTIESTDDLQQPVDLTERPPMTPWAQERYRNNVPHSGPRAIAGTDNDPILRCYPDGLPKVLEVPQPFEVIQIPGRVLINYEQHGLRRQIWTDGRKLPSDPEPSYMGYSVGRWEGDTFIVDSNGFNDLTWLDFDGSPHSTELRVTERYRRVDHTTLEVAVTLEDPKAYTRPWVNKPVTFLLKNWELMEHFCIFDEEMKYRNSIMIPAGGAPLPPAGQK